MTLGAYTGCEHQAGAVVHRTGAPPACVCIARVRHTGDRADMVTKYISYRQLE